MEGAIRPFKTGLPPLRRRVFLAYILIVVVYAAALGAFVSNSASFDAGLDRLAASGRADAQALAARERAEARHRVLALTGFAAATLLLTLLIAQRLARGLSLPLIRIAKELSRPRGLDDPLELPESDSREFEVLRLRLVEWWDQSRRIQRLNVDEVLAQRNKLSAVFASVEDAVLLIDGEGRVSQLNPRGCVLLGVSPESAGRARFDEVAAATANGRALLGWLKGPRGEGAALEMDLEGRRRLFVARERPIEAQDGMAASRLLLLQDVTERRQRERLEEEFIGVLSHELKTPLQSLGMAMELLDRRRSGMDEGQGALLDTMLDDLRRIRSVANDFVQVSRLNVRGIRLNLEGVPLAERLEEWLRPFRLQAAERGVRLEYQRGPGPGLCRLDPVKFPWVVSNLLSNALRVSAPGQAVRVKVDDQTLYVELRVEDEGPGIPPDVERRMFEPYVQGPADGRSPGLLGLGLTIAREVVEAHEGAIEYYRCHPRGSGFRVLLPSAPRPRLGAES